MHFERPPTYIRASPQYILDVIRDSHRQQCQFDPEAERAVDLTFDSTIADWRLACDLLDWQRVRESLARQWNIECPDSVWHSLLEPSGERTLRDLCYFIAKTALHPTITPIIIFGENCEYAAAFQVIRWFFQNAGINVKNIRPSTKIDYFAGKHADVFLDSISKLAPNTLPDIVVENKSYDLSITLLIITIFLTPFSFIVSIKLSLFFIMLLMASWGCIIFTSKSQRLYKIRFGNICNFRELSIVIAHGSRKYRP